MTVPRLIAVPVFPPLVSRLPCLVETNEWGGGGGKALDPPFTAVQMQRYIRFARRLNPVITPEGQKTMVECYRALRENDCVGRNKVRAQLPSGSRAGSRPQSFARDVGVS